MHAHERIDPCRAPRRGPKRERDAGRREIDAGVSEYEEDRDAERASLYDSSDDWGFSDFDDDWTDNEMDDPEDHSMDDAHEFDEFDDDDISARVEDGRIVIEVPIPAGTSPERWAKIVEDLTRRLVIKRTAGDHRIRSAEPTL